MKRLSLLFIWPSGCLLLSVILYLIDYLIFRDAHTAFSLFDE